MNSENCRFSLRGMLALVVLVCFSSLALAAETAPAAATPAPAKTVVAPSASATPAPAAKPAEKAAAAAGADIPLPPGQITLGGLFNDKGAEGYGDVLIPVLMLKSGLLFIEPRGSLNDSDEQEFNIGVGYRQLFPDKNFIVGANAFYDYRETSLDNGFDQVGFGLEFLSKWVDARANYYLPEDDVKTSDRYVVGSSTVTESRQHTGDVTGDGNKIVQTTYVTDSTYDVQVQQHYRMYEQALEGFDCEIGALLPIPVVQDYADVKAFVGYYSFDSDISDRINGVKARLEIRPMASVYLDATYQEDEELFGSTYAVGVRAVLPFDLVALSHGKSPFAGAFDGFKLGKSTAPMSSRLTEMVIRDLHVRTDATEPEEVVKDRVVKSKTLVGKHNRDKKTEVIVDDVTFVDDDNKSGYEDGSWEHPYNTIGEGVANPRRMVYVRDAAQQYYENVVMTEGVTLWGSGCPIYGRGDRFLGGVYPVVNGGGNGPAITMASHTTVAGFEITQPDGDQDKGFGQPGISGDNVTDVDIHCNYIHGSGSTGNGIQIRNSYMDSFEGSIWNNRIYDVRGNGIDINLYEVSSVDVLLANNRVIGNDGHGLSLVAIGTDAEESAEDELPPGIFMARISGDYSYNGQVYGGDGVYLNASDYDVAAALFVDTKANNNRNTGLSVSLQANILSGALFASHEDLDRLDQVIGTVMGGINLMPSASEDGDIPSVSDMLGIGDLYREGGQMQANGNYNGGIWLAQHSDINLAAFVGVQANGNGYENWMDEQKQGGWGGFNIHQYGDDGNSDASVLAMIRCEANDNAPGPGINVYSSSDDLALGVFIDVTANRNYGCGLKGNFNSPYGVAGALVMSSDPMFGLIENLSDNPMLSEYIAPMDMGFIPPYGQVQANDNGGSGINITANGYDAAFAVVLDAQANGNGMDVDIKESTMHAGIQLDLTSEDGTTVGIVASTESVMGMFQEVLDGEDMPVDVDLTGVSTLGPVQANGNAGVGVHIHADAHDSSIVGVIGVEALDNGWEVNYTKNGYVGDGIDIVADAQWGDAMVGLADVNASGNNGVGIHVDALARSDEGEAMIGGINLTANENEYDGLQLTASSYAPASSYLVLAGVQANDSVNGSGINAQVNGRGVVAAALQDIQANGNAQRGIWLDVESYDGDAHVWVGDGAVAAMNDHMGGWDWDLFDEIVPMLPEGGVETTGNGDAGVRIEATAQSGGVLVGVDGLTSTGNGGDMEDDNHAGLAILVNAYGGGDDGNADISVFDSVLTGNTGNGLRIRASADNTLWAEVDGVTSTGNDNSGVKAVLDGWIVEANFTDNVMSGNGKDGLRLNLDADLGIQLFGDYNVMRDNGDDGLDVSTSALNRYYDFGGGIYSSAGMNSMSGNGDYDVERNGKGPFYIMNSYWGGAEPVYGVDYVGNNMQVGGWLSTDPNP